MTPLFACLPVCLTFAAIAIVGAIVVIFDVANRIPGDDQPEAVKEGEPPRERRQSGPPPWWVMLLMIVVIVLLLLISAWYLPE